jgi:hypothetical protein
MRKAYQIKERRRGASIIFPLNTVDSKETAGAFDRPPYRVRARSSKLLFDGRIAILAMVCDIAKVTP